MSNDKNHRELCEALAEFIPGELPRDVFQAVARIMVTATYVVVPLLRHADRTYVLLHRREADDLYYPSMLNTPGTVIRASDENLSAAYGRLLATELQGVSVRNRPVFVNNVFDRIVRGREVSLVHWVEIEEPVFSNHLFDIAKLPDDVVPTDRPRIAMAAAHFRDTTK
jgi:hypothetical protein